MIALHSLSLVEAARRIGDGRLTARAYADALLERIEATDADIGAWAHLDAVGIRREATHLDHVAPGARGPLHGIPVGLKDIIHTVDQPTRMGSAAMAQFHAATDAACLKRMRVVGGYAMGKTVTTEFAFLHPGATRNPWNPRHTPGGSSQGSAAAVAAGQVPAALGTQTNGSVIRPAAYCGVVGFKPTRGAIAFDGVNLFSASLDTLGTFTRSVADAALLASSLAQPGAIGAPPTSTTTPPRFAYLAGFPWTQIGRDASDALDVAATGLRTAGAAVVPVELPDALHETVRTLRAIMLYEAAINLDEVQVRARPQLSGVLNGALDEGRAIPAGDYRHALASRAVMIAAATDWLGHYDAIIAPPAPGGAPEGLGTTGDPSCCTLASLIGAPAITLPIGLDGHGLPLGMQLIASPGNDAKLLAVAAWCEARLPFAGLL